jgi:hypothetical protein
MFVGHYGPAFAGKGAVAAVPLWVLFLAVQFMDVIWAILVLAGIEKLRVVPGFLPANNLDLFYMPYSHGLPGALLLSLVFGLAVALFFRHHRRTVFLVCTAAVFSHWLLDLVVHIPDLPLYANRFKVGFGLWHYLWPSVTLEIALMAAGAAYYARAVPAARRGGGVALWAFVLFLAAVELLLSLAPAAGGTPHSVATAALISYGVLTALAGIVGRYREPVMPRRLFGI